MKLTTDVSAKTRPRSRLELCWKWRDQGSSNRECYLALEGAESSSVSQNNPLNNHTQIFNVIFQAASYTWSWNTQDPQLSEKVEEAEDQKIEAKRPLTNLVAAYF